MQFGFADRARYQELLRDAAAVFSVAHHEFFGIAVVEAMAAGAVPVLPNRLSYPELLAGSGLEPYDTKSQGVEMLAAAVQSPDPDRTRRASEAGRKYDWRTVAPRYDDVLERLARS